MRDLGADFCYRCSKTTGSRAIRGAVGTEIVCAECGTQIDFLHDEEDEVPYWDEAEDE